MAKGKGGGGRTAVSGGGGDVNGPRAALQVGGGAAAEYKRADVQREKARAAAVLRWDAADAQYRAARQTRDALVAGLSGASRSPAQQARIDRINKRLALLQARMSKLDALITG